MDLSTALKDKLSKKELEVLKTAFDVVGDIAIIEIDEGLIPKEKLIGEMILKINKNIKVVLKKASEHKGEFRLQKYDVIAGEKRKETVHKENGVSLKLHVEKTYFSPRLSTERKRIAEQLKKNEEILALFSGCGPYPLVLLKAHPDIRHIVSIEINPDAVRYQKENLIINKSLARKFKGFKKDHDTKEKLTNAMNEKIEVICGNVNDIVPKLKKRFDRILMPLPKSAEEFLLAALSAAKKGTIIHFYDFLDEKDIPQKAIDKIDKACKKSRMRYEILGYIKCGSHSPGHFRICVDFKIK